MIRILLSLVAMVFWIWLGYVQGGLYFQYRELPLPAIVIVIGGTFIWIALGMILYGKITQS